MRTELEQAAVLHIYECCMSELANSISTKLGKYKLCDLQSQLRDMKLARAYLYRINKYYTLPYNYKSAVLIDIVRNNTSNVTITITINGTNYTYTGTDDLATIVTSLRTDFLNAGFNIYSVDDDSFIVYTYDPAFDSPTVTCTNSIDDADNSTTCTT